MTRAPWRNSPNGSEPGGWKSPGYYLGVLAALGLVLLLSTVWDNPLMPVVLTGLVLGIMGVQFGHVLLVRRRHRVAARAATSRNGTTLD